MTSSTPNESSDVSFPQEGDIICGRYRLKEELGRGGMGVVYIAEQLALKRDVAIKVTLKSSDPEVEARFMQEASTAAQIDHPNVVQIHDFGKDEKNRMLLVMELLHGQTLHRQIKSSGPISLQQFQELGEQLTEALCVLQGLGIVHRDIKPENIFMVKTPGKRVISRLIDFGLVKDLSDDHSKTQTGHVLGSPMYMAPEQIKSATIDIRTDIYALGLSLLGAVSGKPPYSSTRIEALLHAQLSTPPAPLNILAPNLKFPPIVQWLLNKATAKDPIDRFQNPQQMLHVFQALATGMSTGRFPDFSMRDGQLFQDDSPIDLDGEPERNLNQTITFDSINTSLIETQENTAETINVEEFQITNQFPTQTTTTLSASRPKWPWALVILLIIGLGFGLYKKTADQKKTPSTIQSAESYTLKSEPSNARVYEGDNSIGQTPFTYTLENGPLKLRLEHDCCDSVEIALSKSNPSPSITLKKKADTDSSQNKTTEPLKKTNSVQTITPSKVETGTEEKTTLKSRQKKRRAKVSRQRTLKPRKKSGSSGSDLKNPWE